MKEWLPIETAPRDASVILLGHRRRYTAFGYWLGGAITEGDPGWYTDGLEEKLKPQPTHWMPLPEPPK